MLRLRTLSLKGTVINMSTTCIVIDCKLFKTNTHPFAPKLVYDFAGLRPVVDALVWK